VQEEDVLAFVAATIKSVWSLEMLLFLRREAIRRWARDGLVRELRGSAVAVDEALASLRSAGLVAEDDQGRFGYAPASRQLENYVADLEQLYRMKPVSVIRSIAASPNEKLRIFADAFRLKE